MLRTYKICKSKHWVEDNAKQKQPGAVKKGAAEQSRIKNIVWHFR